MTLTATTLAQPAASGAPAESLTPQQEAARRKICNWLAYWRDCDAPPCRRARSCAGDPTAGLHGRATLWPLSVAIG